MYDLIHHPIIQVMINSALERQVKSIDELLHRLIEEWDRKKLDTTSANSSSSTCAVSFTQINPIRVLYHGYRKMPVTARQPEHDQLYQPNGRSRTPSVRDGPATPKPARREGATYPKGIL
jgi:hypothetical protein